MTRTLLATAFVLAAGTALAQPAATTPTEPAKPSPSTTTPSTPPASDARRTEPDGDGSERGAFIKIRRPGLSVAIRCADGESTKACGDTVMQLVEKLAAQRAAERRGGRDDDRDYQDDDDRPRGGYRDRWRDRDGYGDRGRVY